MQNSHGYLSNGLATDTESARLSNVQPYKFNTNGPGGKGSQGLSNIRKINPNTVMLKPVSRGSGSNVGIGLKNPQVSMTIPVPGDTR